jgi:hypothetical protein
MVLPSVMSVKWCGLLIISLAVRIKCNRNAGLAVRIKCDRNAVSVFYTCYNFL